MGCPANPIFYVNLNCSLLRCVGRRSCSGHDIILGPFVSVSDHRHRRSPPIERVRTNKRPHYSWFDPATTFVCSISYSVLQDGTIKINPPHTQYRWYKRRGHDPATRQVNNCKTRPFVSAIQRKEEELEAMRWLGRAYDNDQLRLLPSPTAASRRYFYCAGGW